MKRTLIFLILFAVLAMTASAQKLTRRVEMSPVSAFAIGLEQRSSLLNYVSETDAPVSNYISPMTATDLTVETFRYANVIPDNVPIEQRDFDFWLSRQTVRDYRWQVLGEYLQSGGAVTVFRVGGVRAIYYAVILYDNRIVGVKTYGVDT